MTALRDLGGDIVALTDAAFNLKTDVTCTIDVDALFPNQKKRSWFKPIIGA
jgi:hypothetical protein